MTEETQNATGRQWEWGGNRLVHGDWAEVMPTLPEGSIDMVLCDLPYGTTALPWDTIPDLEALWFQYRRAVKARAAILLFGTEPFATRLRASNAPWFKYDWHWVKDAATDCMNAKNRPMRKVEKILVFSSGTVANGSAARMPYYPQGLIPCAKPRKGRDYGATGGSFKRSRPSHRPYVQRFTNYPVDLLAFPKDRERLHPTQKPVALCEYLIRTYTRPGGVVLDNCGGSGTTAIACLNTGRKFILIEKDGTFAGIAAQRITAHPERHSGTNGQHRI